MNDTIVSVLPSGPPCVNINVNPLAIISLAIEETIKNSIVGEIHGKII